MNAHDLACDTGTVELRAMYRDEVAMLRMMQSNNEHYDRIAAQREYIDMVVAAGKIAAEREAADAIPATQTCYKCSGSGEYSWGGSVNGKPVHTGPCFRCDGTGTITARKERGNRYYDNHVMRVA